MEGRVSVIEDYLLWYATLIGRHFLRELRELKRRGLWISEENYHKSAYAFPQEIFWSTEQQTNMCLEQEGVG